MTAKPKPLPELPDSEALSPSEITKSRLGSNPRHRRGSSADGRIGQTLRLNPHAWEQLKVMAIKQRVNTHDMMVEAINDLFQKYGLDRIA
jgi:hypothetical protein